MFLVTTDEIGGVVELFHDKDSAEIPPGAVEITKNDAEKLRQLTRFDGVKLKGKRVIVPRELVVGVELDNTKSAALRKLRETFNNRLAAFRLGIDQRDVGLLRLLSSSIDVNSASVDLRRALLCIDVHDTKRNAINAAADQPALDALLADIENGWPL